MELFEQIRRENEFGVGTIAGVSRKLGVHRRMVREALRSAEPAASKPRQRRLRRLVDASSFIDRILSEDLKAPVKQRHTARRIWQRLRAELPGFTGSERTVCGYVQRQRRQAGIGAHEVFIPQSYDWGVESQVDCDEAYADIDGVRIIPKGLVSDRIVIDTILQKYVAQLPLYRQSVLLERWNAMRGSRSHERRWMAG